MVTVWPRLAASAYSSRDSVGRQRDLRPVHVGDPAVELEGERRAQHEPLARDAVAQPAEHALDAGAKLGVVVGLGDVVLGDLVEEVGLGVGRVDRGQDDDRQVGAGLDLAGEGQAVHARHQHVDHQQVRPGLGEPPQRLVAVAGRLDLVAVGPELLGEDDEQVGVVVDDEDPRDGHAVGPGCAVQHRPRITAGRVSGGRAASEWAGRARRGRRAHLHLRPMSDLPIHPYQRQPAAYHPWDPRTMEVAGELARLIGSVRPGLVAGAHRQLRGPRAARQEHRRSRGRGVARRDPGRRGRPALAGLRQPGWRGPVPAPAPDAHRLGRARRFELPHPPPRRPARPGGGAGDDGLPRCAASGSRDADGVRSGQGADRGGFGRRRPAGDATPSTRETGFGRRSIAWGFGGRRPMPRSRCRRAP